MRWIKALKRFENWCRFCQEVHYTSKPKTFVCTRCEHLERRG